MHALPADWISLLAVVFALGLRHGLDADHLAAIDALTRCNARAGRPLARWCGSLFSAGHGAVVLAIAGCAGAASARWVIPAWLEDTGALVSIGVLSALGLINLRAVFAAAGHEVVSTVGLKSRLIRFDTGRPLAVAGIGALFALSFDTLSQALLFSLAGARFGGIDRVLILGVTFALGMLIADGVNGLWISRLLRNADRAALVASRTMGLAVSGLSLMVAAMAAARYLSADMARWSDGKELGLGLAVLTVVALSYAVALRLASANCSNHAH